jgi:hypothetical protein
MYMNEAYYSFDKRQDEPFCFLLEVILLLHEN